MELEELEKAIGNAGGGGNALAYAPELLKKVQRLEAHKDFAPLLKQLVGARDEGDFRGRALEVNIAAAFLDGGIRLHYEGKQGQPGNVDFWFDVADRTVFIEAKLLGQSASTKADIKAQLQRAPTWQKILSDDTADIVRMQRDIFAKGSIKKFAPVPQANWVNLVTIDMSELQLGAVDPWDCLLAAMGNSAVPETCRRPGVVGAFEHLTAPDAESQRWITDVHRAVEPHLRGYLHGVLFLFRKPAEKAALAYDLSCVIAWNSALLDPNIRKRVSDVILKAIPAYGAEDPQGTD
jgi:hypothetical protein